MFATGRPLPSVSDNGITQLSPDESLASTTFNVVVPPFNVTAPSASVGLVTAVWSPVRVNS